MDVPNAHVVKSNLNMPLSLAQLLETTRAHLCSFVGGNTAVVMLLPFHLGFSKENSHPSTNWSPPASLLQLSNINK